MRNEYHIVYTLKEEEVDRLYGRACNYSQAREYVNELLLLIKKEKKPLREIRIIWVRKTLVFKYFSKESKRKKGEL
jgi:hypothetical protein